MRFKTSFLLALMAPVLGALSMACGGGDGVLSNPPTSQVATTTPVATSAPVTPTPAAFAFEIPPRFPLQSGPRVYTVDEAVEAYLQVVFNSPTAKLIRWGKAPVVNLQGSPSQADRQIITSAVEDLNALTNLQISVRDGDSGDISVYFIAKKDFEDTFRRTVTEPTTLNNTLTELKNNPKAVTHGVWLFRISVSQIAFAVIAIDHDLTTPEAERFLLRENLTHSLGLPAVSPQADMNSVLLSKLNNFDLKDLAPIDRFIVWAHYSPALSPGMTRDEAKRALTTLLQGKGTGPSATPVATPCPAPPAIRETKPSFSIRLTLAESTRGDTREPVNPTTTFTTDATVHAVVRIEDAPANTTFEAIWTALDVGDVAACNSFIDKFSLSAEGTRNLDFQLSPERTWPKGSYQVQILVNGTAAIVQSFTVKS